jgi:zinc protease
LLYGDKHPWGQPVGGTAKTLKALTPADLKKFHQTYFRPNNVVVSVSGDVAPADAQKLLEGAFSGWKAKPLPPRKTPPLPALRRGVTWVDKPNATQSQVWVAGRLFPANHPDAVPMRLANYILGGTFSSRLNLNVRERKGYSYGVRSGLALTRATGALLCTGGIVAEHTADALAEYEKELTRLASGDLTEDELAMAKAAYLRSLPSVLETNDAVASAFNTLIIDGLPLDYFRTLPARIEHTTKAEVAGVVRKHLHPESWPIVIVGPLKAQEQQVKALKLGTVEVRAAE